MRANYVSNQPLPVGVLDEAECPDGRVGPPIYNGVTATPLWFTLTSIRGSVWDMLMALSMSAVNLSWGFVGPSGVR